MLPGSARFELDGERVSIDRERMIRVGAGTGRKLEPGPDGVRILVVEIQPEEQIVEYLMFVCRAPLENPDAAHVEEAIAWMQEMDARGVRKFGNRLRDAGSATTLRSDGDRVLVSDGPFAEPKEPDLHLLSPGAPVARWRSRCERWPL